MKCDIEGVIIRELTRHTDQRGWLIELFRSDELDTSIFPAMSYLSLTRPGVVRGPHEHRGQTDHFAFIGPSTFRLYLWDNRPGSATGGKAFQLEAGENNPRAVIVPPGIVHAYRNVGTVDGLVFNAPDKLFRGRGKAEPIDEIRHEDDPESPFKLDE